MGQILSVISGKGGTGKTSLCAGIAASLAAQGQRVLCMDADIGLRNLDIALGMSELSILSFTDVMSGHYSLNDAAKHPQIPNLQLLTAPIRQRAEDISVEDFGKLLEQVRTQFDWCLIDAGAGIGAGFHLATAFADRVLVVANSDPASLRDAARCADLLYESHGEKMRLVVNRISPKLLSRMAVTVDDVMDGVGIQLIGIVPEDPRVVLAAAHGQALILKTPKGASRACANIARRLTGERVPLMKLS